MQCKPTSSTTSVTSITTSTNSINNNTNVTETVETPKFLGLEPIKLVAIITSCVIVIAGMIISAVLYHKRKSPPKSNEADYYSDFYNWTLHKESNQHNTYKNKPLPTIYSSNHNVPHIGNSNYNDPNDKINGDNQSNYEEFDEPFYGENLYEEIAPLVR